MYILPNYSELPDLQQSFIDSFDGIIDSILSFPDLARVINPCFTSHYLYVSGKTMEKTITTRTTTGETISNGVQSRESENNAYELSRALKSILIDFGLYTYTVHGYAPFAPTLMKCKLFTKHKGQYRRIPGLTTRNV